MTPELVLFIAGFSQVFLLGFQSLNINRGKFVLAAIFSALISVANLFLWKYGSQIEGMSQFIFYTISGPIAIVLAMWVHRRFI